MASMASLPASGRWVRGMPIAQRECIEDLEIALILSGAVEPRPGLDSSTVTEDLTPFGTLTQWMNLTSRRRPRWRRPARM